ncbi:MAG: PHB depolymerase family esterase [Myxococcota bacterium]
MVAAHYQYKMMRSFVVAAGLSAAFIGCSSDSMPLSDQTDASTDAGAEDAGAEDAGMEDAGSAPMQVTLGADRPATMRVPSTYDGSAFPLIILLHGYTSNGAQQDAYFGLSNLVDTQSFFLILPDGTQERTAFRNRFWNATDACCDFTDTNVDDVEYLLSLVDEASATFNIDPKRVMVAGHSNGGFMAYRLACEASDRIAAVASLAGATFNNEADCAATEPVSVLQVHGTQDATIRYEGGDILGVEYPGAEQTVQRWAARAGCSTPSVSGDRRDLDRSLESDETATFVYNNCADGIDVMLWQIEDGSHVPPLNENFAAGIVDFLLSHPKP